MFDVGGTISKAADGPVMTSLVTGSRLAYLHSPLSMLLYLSLDLFHKTGIWTLV